MVSFKWFHEPLSSLSVPSCEPCTRNVFFVVAKVYMGLQMWGCPCWVPSIQNCENFRGEATEYPPNLSGTPWPHGYAQSQIYFPKAKGPSGGFPNIISAISWVGSNIFSHGFPRTGLRCQDLTNILSQGLLGMPGHLVLSLGLSQ